MENPLLSKSGANDNLKISRNIAQIKPHEVGNKALGLKFLQFKKFKVPNFYVLSYSLLIGVEKGEIKLEKLISDWFWEYSIDENSLWAVRSSANVEDGKHESYAGLFRTETNVKTTDIPQAVWRVLEAYQQVKEKKYSNSTKEFKYGIIIQEMINPDFSGVIFSKNPMNPGEKEILINIVPGLGENLVSGKYESLQISYKKHRFSYKNIENEFFGEKLEESVKKEFALSGTIIKKQIESKLNELIKGVKKLSQLKKQAVDVEFTVKNNQIYWLQVRPITTLKKQETVIWDNSNIGENYPGITLPLSASFVRYTYYIAYAEMSTFLGLNIKAQKNIEPYLKNMSGEINGRLYYNVTSWQKLLYTFPFGKKLSKQYPKALGMAETDFIKPKKQLNLLAYLKLILNLLKALFGFKKLRKRYINSIESMVSDYKQANFEGKTHQELIREFYSLQKRMLADWVAPMLNGLFALAFFSLLKKVVRKSNLVKKYPNFINDVLFSQGDVISVKIVTHFQNLLQAIGENEGLFNLFHENDEKIIYEKLKTDYPSFYESINQYIENFGERCDTGELKIETINYKENPVSFISFLKKNSRKQTNKKHSSFSFDYKKAVYEEYKNKPVKRKLLLSLIKISLRRIKDRENFRFMRTKTFHLVRRIFRAINKVLLENGKIKEIGDSYYLTFEELVEQPKPKKYARIIETRKKLYESYKNKKVYNRYRQIGDKISPALEMNLSAAELKGIGCCSGIVSEKVMVITNENVNTADVAGKILIADYFEPGWINLFSQAAGLVSEKGNLLSHTAILCREMGIPSIVGAKGALNKVKTGDFITIDGATGNILLKKDNNETT